MNNYRKIYEQNYGPIPRNENGRKYEIHHIDGNHENDSPENLKAVTIQEHYDIHYARGDWGACQSIAVRMNKTSEEISELAKKNALARIYNGTHNFLGPEHNLKRVAEGIHPFQTRPDGTSLASDRVTDGTHPFQTRPDGTNLAIDRVADGTHNFLNREVARKNNLKRLANGTHHFLTNHPTKTIVKCPYCPKEGPAPQMKQWHFDNCKFKEKNDKSI